MLLYLGVTDSRRPTGNDSVLFCGSQNNHSESALQILFELAGFVRLLQTQDVQARHLPEQNKSIHKILSSLPPLPGNPQVFVRTVMCDGPSPLSYR